MLCARSNSYFHLSVLSSGLFLLAFPLMVHFVPGGELFGAFMVVPLTLIAWNYGRRAGVLAAIAGIVCTEAVFSPEYFVVHHNTLSFYWVMMVTAPAVVFFFVGFVVGKLGDALSELRATKDALTRSEATAQQYLDIAEVLILVLDRQGKIVLLNKKGKAVFGSDDGQLIGKDYFTVCLPSVVQEDMRNAFIRVMKGGQTPGYSENPVVTRSGEERLVAWRHVLLKDDQGVIVGSISSGEDITERRKAKRALEASNAHLEAILNAMPDLLLEVDRRGTLYELRSTRPESLPFPQSRTMLGKRLEEALPRQISSPIMSAVAQAAEKGRFMSSAFAYTNRGETHWYELSVAPVGDTGEEDGHFVVLERDVSDRVRLEQQLIQAQKMESVGRLAGGVAHDFNNILQVILGFCEILLSGEDDRESSAKHVRTIKESAERAASLTMQLLAFSRKQKLAFKIINVDSLISEAGDMLARMAGEDVVLVHERNPEGIFVRADPGQLQQILMNLTANARDAMPEGGRLTLRVTEEAMTADDPRRPVEMRPGRYALLQVSDTGAGMDEETLSHLFEPFFTTKELGKGTGLGLSIVYGIVKQSQGYIYVTSRLGSGTTFRIYFPRMSDPRESSAACPEEEPRGTETVLLVEDEDAVRDLLQRQLTACGYVVLAAADGFEALEVCRQNPGRIHLLLTDLLLPGIRGSRVAEAFLAANPKGRVIYMSGYADAHLLSEFDENATSKILQKPFSFTALASSMRKALDQPEERR